MKVKVNIITTLCILMSEAVTVPRLMMMTSKVSEESLAMHPRTHAQTHVHTGGETFALSILKMFKVVIDFENKISD